MHEMTTDRVGGDSPAIPGMAEADATALAAIAGWLADALEDLTAAQRALASPDVLKPRPIGFLAQQAAEKALKAALSYARSPEMEPIHNLTRLVERLPDDGTWKTRTRYTNLGSLSLFAVEARYRINDVPVTSQQARTACNLARGIYESCLADLMAHGFQQETHPDRAGGNERG